MMVTGGENSNIPKYQNTNLFPSFSFTRTSFVNEPKSREIILRKGAFLAGGPALHARVEEQFREKGKLVADRPVACDVSEIRGMAGSRFKIFGLSRIRGLSQPSCGEDFAAISL